MNVMLIDEQERGQATQSALSSALKPPQVAPTRHPTSWRVKWLKRIIVSLTTGAFAAAITFFNTCIDFSGKVTHMAEIDFSNKCTAQTPINFNSPPSKEPIMVGEYADAYGFNKWPKGEDLWLFVFADNSSSSPVYYPTSHLVANGNSWVFNKIRLGRPSDIGLLYPIDLVLANKAAGKAIQAQVNANAMNNGIKTLPAGASVVASVVVSRVC